METRLWKVAKTKNMKPKDQTESLIINKEAIQKISAKYKAKQLKFSQTQKLIQKTQSHKPRVSYLSVPRHDKCVEAQGRSGLSPKITFPRGNSITHIFLHLFLCSGGLCLKHIVGSLTHTSDSDIYIYSDFFFLKVKNVQKSVLIRPEKILSMTYIMDCDESPALTEILFDAHTADIHL